MNATIRPPRGSRVAAVVGVGLLAVLAACTTSTAPPATSTTSSLATRHDQRASAAARPRSSRRPRRMRSVRRSAAFTGRIDQDGTETIIDFKGTSDGTSADVTLQIAGEGKVRVISVGRGVYLQGDAPFWKKQGLPVTARGRQVRQGTRRGQGAHATAQPQRLPRRGVQCRDAVAAVRHRGSESVGGVDAWVITDTKGQAEGALYVSKDGVRDRPLHGLVGESRPARLLAVERGPGYQGALGGPGRAARLTGFGRVEGRSDDFAPPLFVECALRAAPSSSSVHFALGAAARTAHSTGRAGVLGLRGRAGGAQRQTA